MKQTKKQIFSKVQQVASSVKKELRNQGYIIPVKEADGTINFDGVRVRKLKGTFYTVYDKYNSPVVENLNLLQTAIVLANNVALGRWPDIKLIEADKQYGYHSFKVDVYTARRNKAIDLTDSWLYYDTRHKIAQENSEKYKKVILNSFDKLSNIR
jgi:hypothetical protein